MISIRVQQDADEVTRKAAAGSVDAFTVIVNALDQEVIHVCFLVCQDIEMARDAAQAAWQKVWQRLRTLRDPGKLRSWVLAVAANEARQAVRRDRGRRAFVAHLRADDSPGALGVSDARDADRLIDLEQALSRLRPEDRALLALRYVAGLDSVELGRLVGRSPSGIRGRLHRLRVRLQEELDDG